MDNSIVMVNDEPYCIWEVDVAEKNKEFINGVDVEYFNYLNELYQQSDDEKRASIALKSALHHATETLFSLIGALLQAPTASYAWVAKCNNSDLRKLLKRINDKDDSLFTVHDFSKLTWKAVAGAVFKNYLPGTERQEKTAELFSSLWQRLSYEFLEQNHIDEYNSIKHGFRIKSGGFSIAMGMEQEFGVAPPPENMKLLGGSDFGASFFTITTVGDSKGNRSLTSKRVSMNWKIEKVALLLQLVTTSINNVTSELKIVNGIDASTCLFTRPVEDSDFNAPWIHTPGVTSSSFNFVIDESKVPVTNKKELLIKISEYRKQLQSDSNQFGE